MTRSFFQRQCDAAYNRDWPAAYALSAALHEQADNLLAGRYSNVYVIRDTETGAIKIGTAVDTAARLSGLQGGNAHTLELVDWAPASPLVERFFHSHLAEHRIRGEWFTPTDAVLIVCEFVMAAGDMRRTMLEQGFTATDEDTLAVFESEFERAREWLATHPFQLSMAAVA